jgi:hypothetical protein
MAGPRAFNNELHRAFHSKVRSQGPIPPKPRRQKKSCSSPFPVARDVRAESKAVYGFMDDPGISPESMLATHRQATLERMNA